MKKISEKNSKKNQSTKEDLILELARLKERKEFLEKQNLEKRNKAISTCVTILKKLESDIDKNIDLIKFTNKLLTMILEVE